MKLALPFCLLFLASSFNLPAQRIPPLNPKRLGIGPTRSFRCYPLRYDSNVGLNYGIQKEIFGIYVHDFRSWQWGIPLMLFTEMEWRVPRKGKGYFNLEFTREQIASIGKFSLASNLGYRRVLSSNLNVYNQLYTGLSLFARYYGVTLAYARQYQSQSEKSIGHDNGIMLQLYHEFFDQVDVKISCTYWFDQFQYTIKIKENLFQSSFYAGIAYEKIRDWKEFDISIGYHY